jgi:DNA-3-methyladenine glycosylase I
MQNPPAKAEIPPVLTEKKRTCPWPADDPLMLEYHDVEWGVPVHDDRLLLEGIILDGFQAGLSWKTILHKRTNFRRAFCHFDPVAVASLGEKAMHRLMQDPGIIRNRLKIEAAIRNARCFLKIQEEFGSFDAYLWRFVGGKPILNSWRDLKQIPATSPESDCLSADLKQRGFKFAGSTICYAFMQAVGMVNDHLVSCFRYEEINRLVG